jgi:hypothetical protein
MAIIYYFQMLLKKKMMKRQLVTTKQQVSRIGLKQAHLRGVENLIEVEKETESEM